MGPNENQKGQQSRLRPKIIEGPIDPTVGGIIYQVTLASGAILTNPGAFPEGCPAAQEVNPYIAQDGRFLTKSDAFDVVSGPGS